ncbi:MAG: Opr family porin [Aliarcobacter sp.]|nr:Opr family porin [Aliarcobacter sp.]
MELNPYFYSAPDLADFYGFKFSYDNELFGTTAHYALSNEDTQKNGNIYNLEARLNILGFALSTGYIETQKDVGAGNISSFGDNMSPLDDGEQVYSADAKTIYATAAYPINDLTLKAIYGSTQFDENNLDADELNLIAEYSITEELNTALTYVDYKEDQNDSNYEKLFANITYSF